MYGIITLIVLSAVLFAYEETQEQIPTKWGDIREHIASVFHRGSLIALGYCFALYGDWLAIPVLLGVYWLLTDGVMNLFKSRNFFAVSSQSGNPFEKWNLAKFILIIIGVVIYSIG